MTLQPLSGTRLFSVTTVVALLSFAVLAQSALACEASASQAGEEALDVRDPLFAEKLAARYQAGLARPDVKAVAAVNRR